MDRAGGEHKVASPPARPFQATGTAWLRGLERALLADDPGLGKTRTALDAAEPPLLITGPTSLYGTWQDEIALWRPDLIEAEDWAYAPYSMLCRRGPDSRGNFTKVLSVPKPEYKQEWRTRIADEAHALKGRDTNWVKAYEKIPSEQLFMLTGTAIPNWAHEIYMILKFLRPPGVDVNSYWRWVERWFKVWEKQWKKGGPKTKNVEGTLKACDRSCRGLDPDAPCEHWIEFIVENGLHTHMLRRTWDEVGHELPPVVAQTIMCPMHPAQEKAYKSIEKDYLAWIDGVGELACWSDGDQHSKLVQLTTGLDSLKGDAVGSGKLDMLETLMDSRRHTHTLIGCHFRQTADAIQRRMERMGLQCGVIKGGIPQTQIDDTRRAFQRKEFPVIVATIDKVREGFTLTAADAAIQVERSFRPDKNLQFFKRVHRMGQERPVQFITLLTDNATERAQTKVLDTKNAQQVTFMRAQEMGRLLRESA